MRFRERIGTLEWQRYNARMPTYSTYVRELFCDCARELKGEAVKSLVRWIKRRWYHGLLVLFFVLSIVFAMVSGIAHPSHFWWHICIELSVALFTLLLTVVIVEKMLDHQRTKEQERRWSSIKTYTIDTLTGLVSEITLHALSLLNDQEQTRNIYTARMESCRNSATKEGAAILNEIPPILAVNLASSGCPSAFEHRRLGLWYIENDFAFGILLDIVAPRFNDFAPDHPVIENVLELQSRLLGIQGRGCGRGICRGGLPAQFYSQIAMEVVGVCCRIYDILANLPDK